MRELDGRPQPPQDVLARLRRYDERLGLFYTNAAWAITETWREDDPRREWIRDGSVQPEMAFDICGHLPVTASLEEAPAYIERSLRSYKPEEWKSLRDAARDWNMSGIDAQQEDEILGHVDNALTKSGPSIGVFAVPAQLIDNNDKKEEAPPPDPAIAAAMSSRRRKKTT